MSKRDTARFHRQKKRAEEYGLDVSKVKTPKDLKDKLGGLRSDVRSKIIYG